MPKIALTKGFVTTIDAADLPLVEHWKWHVRTTGNVAYARRNATVAGRTHAIYMHRPILAVDEDVFVTHTDGNGLNNRRRNLVVVLPYGNLWTRKPKAVGVALSLRKRLAWRIYRRPFARQCSCTSCGE